MSKDTKESEEYNEGIEEEMSMLIQWKQKKTKLARINIEIDELIKEIIDKWRKAWQ